MPPNYPLHRTGVLPNALLPRHPIALATEWAGQLNGYNGGRAIVGSWVESSVSHSNWKW